MTAEGSESIMQNLSNKSWRRSALGAGLAALVGVTSWAFAAPVSVPKDIDHAKSSQDRDASQAIHKANELSHAFSHAADEVRPAVVSIQSTKSIKADNEG